jgi:hypothetical protein
VQANAACSDPVWVAEFEPPDLEDAREFVTIGKRVDAGEWRYQSLVIACEYSGQIGFDGELYSFRAHPTGSGWIRRDSDGWGSPVLCYDCVGWRAEPYVEADEP